MQSESDPACLQPKGDPAWLALFNFLKRVESPEGGVEIQVLVSQISGKAYGPLAFRSDATFADLKDELVVVSGVPKLLQTFSVNESMPQDDESLSTYSQPDQAAIVVTLIKSIVNQSHLQSSIDCSSQKEQIDTLKYLLGSSGLPNMLPGIKLFVRSADPEVRALAQEVWSVAGKQRRVAMVMKSQPRPGQD